MQKTDLNMKKTNDKINTAKYYRQGEAEKLRIKDECI